MGLGEILMIILLSMAIILIALYYCKKKKQQRLRELNNAMAMAYRSAGDAINYPHRSAVRYNSHLDNGQFNRSRVHHHPQKGYGTNGDRFGDN